MTYASHIEFAKATCDTDDVMYRLICLLFENEICRHCVIGKITMKGKE